MAWLLFIDESGTDGRDSPYEVLAGFAIEDRRLWPLIQDLKQAQDDLFGIRLFDAYGAEAKAKKLLKTKTFRLAAGEIIPRQERAELARMALADGAAVHGAQLRALAQSKLAYVGAAFDLCRHHGAIAFASILPQEKVRPAFDFMRKDYAFLFERFFHFLNSRPDMPRPMGEIVFDELDKVASHRLLSQMERYFLHTNKGRARSRLIIPEPLFVHSDLTTMVQMADLLAYVISWGVRLTGMALPARPELAPYARQALRLRYHAATAGGYDTWGFKLIRSLDEAPELQA